MIFDQEPTTWKELQSLVGQMFTECGFYTVISKIVELVRGKKEIDVFSQDLRSEYKPIIFVECKYWTSHVKQETIHSFRTVVNDFGANIGFIVAKNGFQSGCYEAAKNTNIKLVSLKELEQEYYSKWKKALTEKYMPYADILFPYWDYPGKIPKDGGKIDIEKQNLVYSAYMPISSLSPVDEMKNGFNRYYPMTVPIINDNLDIIGEEKITTDRQYFDFIEKNKDLAIRHYKILYRELN